MKRVLGTFTVLILFYCSVLFAETGERFALVIGNSDYQHASVLKNPKNDSNDIAKALEDLFFETTLVQDVTRQQIEFEINKFLTMLEHKKGVGLFYYAGHGVQLNGENYLVPVETRAGTDKEIREQSFNISKLLNGMRKSQNATNIIILDACRDNPFKSVSARGSRSVSGNDESRGLHNKDIPKIDTGLSKLDAPPNTLIAFATAPGRVAMDGDGENSPYTTKLIESMQRTGLTIGQVFRQVRADVVEQTDGKQIPWESSSLIQDFYFKPRTAIPMGF